MSHFRVYGSANADEGEWESVVDHKKQGREARRERKQEAVRTAAALGISADDHDDPLVRSSHSGASFYKDLSKKKSTSSKSRHVTNPEDEDEYTFHTGQPNPLKKKGGKGKPKSAVPQYNTADEIAEALVDIITFVPPTEANDLSITIAALGDKLSQVTKAPWNKKYKAEYGTLKSFVEQRDEFEIDGDVVRLSKGDKKKKKQSNAASSSSSSSSSASKQQQKNQKAGGKSSKQQQNESDDEEESEVDEDDEEESSSRTKLSKRKGNKNSSSSSACSVSTILSLLVLGAAGVGFAYYAQLTKQ